jgi:3-phenylpropionate/cinnamic acid dioxygenase small subunit
MNAESTASPVDQVGAVQAITALVHEYAFRLDAGDFDGVAALFAHAELRSTLHDRVRRGAVEARALYERVVVGPDGTPGTMHLVTNVTVRVDGAAATARSYFTVLQVTAPGLHPILGGEYRDEFVQTEEGWRFAAREFVPMLTGDLTHHLRP